MLLFFGAGSSGGFGVDRRILNRNSFHLMSKNTPITVARGDGIGPEIMEATLAILKGGGARLDIEEIEIGEKVYLRGNTAGIEPSAWDSLRRTKVFLKAPITTPPRRRLQEPECDHAEGFRTLCQHSALHCLCSLHSDETSGYGCGYCSGE